MAEDIIERMENAHRYKDIVLKGYYTEEGHEVPSLKAQLERAAGEALDKPDFDQFVEQLTELLESGARAAVIPGEVSGPTPVAAPRRRRSSKKAEENGSSPNNVHSFGSTGTEG